MMNDNNSAARIKELEEKIGKLEEKVKVLEAWKESVEGRKHLEVESANDDKRLKADMELYKIVVPLSNCIWKMMSYMSSEEFIQQFLPKGSYRPRTYFNSLRWKGTIITNITDLCSCYPKPEDNDFEIKFIDCYNWYKNSRAIFNNIRINLPDCFYSTPSDKLTKEFIFDNLIVGVIERCWKNHKHYDVVYSKLREYFTGK